MEEAEGRASGKDFAVLSDLRDYVESIRVESIRVDSITDSSKE